MVTIGELFTENRFPSGWKLIPVLIYLPVGLILATIRLFIGIQVILAATLLCKLTSIRSVVLRIMCGILGVFVFKENEEVEDDSVKVIVSNHVSVLDHVAINLLKNSVSINTSELPSFLHYALYYKDTGNYRNQEILVQNVKSLISNDVTVDIQPEMGITSGQKGLLRFSTWPCKLSHPIQPVAIRVWRPPLMDISPSVLNTSWPSELFWFLFVPYTLYFVKFSFSVLTMTTADKVVETSTRIYNITTRFIPVVKPTENETPEEMSKRLEKIIAKELKISSTNFTLTDKVEFEKRLSSERSTVKPCPTQYHYDPNLTEMASRVKEVLSDIPLNVICKDLARTRSVDLTVANFLEGLVKYTPEKSPSPASTVPQTVVPDTKASLNAAQPSTSFDTSSKIFHKSAQERMISFQERKLRLIQSARQRYMEKHALNIMNSS